MNSDAENTTRGAIFSVILRLLACSDSAVVLQILTSSVVVVHTPPWSNRFVLLVLLELWLSKFFLRTFLRSDWTDAIAADGFAISWLA